MLISQGMQILPSWDAARYSSNAEIRSISPFVEIACPIGTCTLDVLRGRMMITAARDRLAAAERQLGKCERISPQSVDLSGVYRNVDSLNCVLAISDKRHRLQCSAYRFTSN